MSLPHWEYRWPTILCLIMLSVIVLSAITAVALPSLRITTLSMMRVISISAILIVYGLIMIGTYDAGYYPSTAGLSPLVNIVPSSTMLFDGLVIIDTLGIGTISLVMITLATCLVHYTSSSNRDMHAGSYTLTLLIGVTLIGSYYLATSHDFITIALSLELQSFSVYAITTLYRWRSGATAAGLMYFILGAFSSGLVLLGVSLVYALTGQTAYDTVANLYMLTAGGYSWLAITVILCGIIFKVAAAPFHYWSPTVYDSVPTVVIMIIALIPKAALIALLIRISPIWMGGVSTVVIACVVMSLIIGSIMGLVQTRIKRLLAYSTISHVGWVLLAVSVGGVLGIGATAFYLSQYMFVTSLSVLLLIGLGYAHLGTNEHQPVNVGDVESVTSLYGLYSRSIGMCLIMSMSLLSAAGIPPTIGFYAKLSVMQASLIHSQYLVVAVGVITSVISAGFYLSVVAGIVFRPVTR